MKPTFKIAAAVALCIAVTASAALAQEADRKIRSMPGYVDFQAMEVFKGQEAKIEVYLKEPMLKLVNKFIKEEDPELYDVLSKLKLVRVQVFDVDSKMRKQYSNVAESTTKQLDDKGWERIVRVRDEEENVDVYLRPSENYESILGIVVMVSGYEEAVFVNIVGEINPEDVSRLGEHFDIDELDDVHIDTSKRKKDSD
jgi:hypothetical protein